MTINTKELIDAVSVVAENHNIRLTVKSSLKSSALVGATTFVGAIVRFLPNYETSISLSASF